MSRIIIIGGGAAGMFAGIIVARNGHSVTLLEKNEKLGKKLYITGKGRCNLTNACDMETLFNNIKTNAKFMYSSLYGFNNFDAIDFFEQIGLKTKIERGDRVFPESDKSSDVLMVLESELRRLGVRIKLNSEVRDVISENGCFKSVRLRDGKELLADHVIIATGGVSYKLTGSTGDGYRFAKEMGHKITDTYPSLVPFNIKEEWTKELQGLSLRNISIRVEQEGKEIYYDFGELLFTHYGVSGPVILSASRAVIPYLKNKNLTLSIDLKPALDNEQLDKRILRDFEMYKNKQFKNSLDELLPQKLIPVIIKITGISPEKKVTEITKNERAILLDTLKNLKCSIINLRDYNEAVITCGGINVKDINPSTMESKLVKNVYFAGEVLDIDALTGGFNLQLAWSSAYSAANSIAD
ncbi:MAG: hypothetical protein K0R15_672 [Clostridiales bacterium]|jgi:predicted Rossmann fold flavoprotein|nr:hypothetical protein [Clostridiales bacterium]